jgi:hypothetical protein
MKEKETHLSPQEAWKDFMENVLPGLLEAKALTPEQRNTIIVANRAAGEEGAIQANPDGTKRRVRLGLTRMKRLFDKHCPGRYKVQVGFVLLNEPAQ